MMDALVILACGIAVAAFMLWLRAWPTAFADVLWALALRPRLVGAVIFVVCALLLVASLIVPYPGLAATRFIGLLALAPFVIRPASHRLAAWRDKADKPTKAYILDHKRAAQKDKFMEEDGAS